ncbi:MAG: hypothetical protein R6U63_10740 [Longimicrobiales bacterium]
MTNHDEARCRRCLRPVPGDDLDRILWCEDCVEFERKRAARWGRGLALAAAALLGIWIALAISPGGQFRYLYALVIIVAYVLGSRLGTELVFGIARVRNRPGVLEGVHEPEGT